jgi:hypothetical protein
VHDRDRGDVYMGGSGGEARGGGRFERDTRNPRALEPRGRPRGRLDDADDDDNKEWDTRVRAGSLTLPRQDRERGGFDDDRRGKHGGERQGGSGRGGGRNFENDRYPDPAP